MKPNGARSKLQMRSSEYRTMIQLARNSSAYRPLYLSLTQMCIRPRREVLCAPRSVKSALLLGKLFTVSGYRITFDPNGDYDFSVRVPARGGQPVFNARHIDNGKTRVAEAWAQASGYALSVDPLSHIGPMVEKSEANATHDGGVVDGPLSANDLVPGKVYQRLVDNSDNDEVVDIRVPMYRGQIPMVYIKRRPVSSRFSNTNKSVTVETAESVFSSAEIRVISRFAWLAGLDYGEADVLRDRRSGQIYVVDSTNGPAGPPNALPVNQARYAVRRLAEAFDAAVESAISGDSWDPFA